MVNNTQAPNVKISSNLRLVVKITAVFLPTWVSTTRVCMPLTAGGLPFFIKVPNERSERNINSKLDNRVTEKPVGAEREI
jgi:hypothetical protein